MPIALSPVQLPQTLHTASISSGSGDGSGKPHGIKTSRTATDESPSPEKENQQGDIVTLSAANDSARGAYIPAVPYAEIWKDGRKVAEVDSRGNVSAFSGLVAALPGGGSGLTVAAQRAALIARSVGGEIRVAGLVTDVPTLTMHTRLAQAYGN